jgi:WhiB family redox-sensing transcriptional regulator
VADTGWKLPTMSWAENWARLAACRSIDPETLFATSAAAQHRAKSVCFGCPVRAECLADALDNGITFGVWGGMTERERRALLRRRPDVRSWRLLLEHARNRHHATVPAAAGEPPAAVAMAPTARH